MAEYLGNPGGISLGPVVKAGHGFTDYPHEFGHTWQSRLLGPFYIFIIGIPSIISAGTNPTGHNNFYTERVGGRMGLCILKNLKDTNSQNCTSCQQQLQQQNLNR